MSTLTLQQQHNAGKQADGTTVVAPSMLPFVMEDAIAESDGQQLTSNRGERIPPPSSNSSLQATTGIDYSSCSTSDNSSVQRQKPIIPRIIIPDGTSIHLSTPSTTPHQEHASVSRMVSMSNWSRNLMRMLDRIGSRRGISFSGNKDLVQGQGQSQEERSEEQRRAGRQERGHGPLDIEMSQASPMSGLGRSRQLSESPAALLEEGEHRRRVLFSQFGVMGLPISGYRPESIASGEKWAWRIDDGEEEELPGRAFSRERWRYLLCSSPVGKVRDREQVSDFLPHNLRGLIMEAQIVVLKDVNVLHEWRQPLAHQDVAYPNHSQGADLDRWHSAGKIPVWTGSVKPGCFNKKCDIEHLGKEYFAFMKPASFGISLEHNWPSLCNSCIEVSVNQFVYNTRVRILGDLLSCAADAFVAPGNAIAPHISTPQTSVTHLQGNPSFQQHIKTGQEHHPQHRYKNGRQHTKKQDRTSPHHTSMHQSFDKRQEVKAITGTAPWSGHTSLLSNQDVAGLPYLVVDPATFSNLTAFDSPTTLANLDHLRVDFRFVLCDS
ncbi:hypothetical protein EDD11_002169 [Mortierella claussenii]|nr:hypothetical protein EDD11_002169 [Mortierella claussenii]